MEFLQQFSGALTFLATIILAAITGFYAWWTKGILAATANQSRVTLNPVVGIRIADVDISMTFGPRRRQLSVSLELTNVGNAPAVEVLVDAEITLRHSTIHGHRCIPMRHEPDVVPFIRPGETVTKPSPNFGNTLVTSFFDDVRESDRLNQHRIETDPTQEPFNASRLRVITYYRNSLGQLFRSYYETEVTLWRTGKKNVIPSDKETASVDRPGIPRPAFHASVVDQQVMTKELSARNAIRNLCGW